MIGYDDYTKQLSTNYPKDAWLTPTEIFQPFYGMTIGNYIHQILIAHNLDQKKNLRINITEVGGGNGTNANGVLYFFKNYEKKLYYQIQYTILELSSTLCQNCSRRLAPEHDLLLKNGQIRIINDDILYYKPITPSEDINFVIFLEVLDNMPHDRVYFNSATKKWEHQAMVEFSDKNGNVGLKEIRRPISDPLIR